MSGDNQNFIDDCRNELKKIEAYILTNPLDSNCPYLISYCIIRGCGTIERVLKNIIFDHLVQNANNEARNYFDKNITDSSWNPSCGQIQRILDVINPNWSIQFQNQTNSMNEKLALKSLVTLRNSFAHGQLITASITEVIKYYDGGCVILNILSNIVR